MAVKSTPFAVVKFVYVEKGLQSEELLNLDQFLLFLLSSTVCDPLHGVALVGITNNEDVQYLPLVTIPQCR